MPTFRTGTVAGIIEQRAGLQRVAVDLEDGPARAYVLTELTGATQVGDTVVLNTTAVELGLGTGGWHVVHWNLSRRSVEIPGPGHIMKLRYTSLQADTGSAEEHGDDTAPTRPGSELAGMPVVAVSLHSQLAGVVVAAKLVDPSLRIAYVMTDAAALPLALSDLVAALQERGLVDATVTAGQAFGGDLEAVNVFSALEVARHQAGAALAVVGMGPGIVGTGTRLGHGALEAGQILDAAVGLGGLPVATVRASDADPRLRHRGVSHHTMSALTTACRSRVRVAIPRHPDADPGRLARQLEQAGVGARHDLVEVDTPDIVAAFTDRDLSVRSMGRAAAEDPVLHLCAAAAGTLAAHLAAPS